MSGFPVKHVANTLLQRDFEDGVATITPMKIQKLVYCLHGWHLAITGDAAIDGQFEAWPYGPVEEDLYHLFKGYKNQPITSYAKSWRDGKEKAFVIAPKHTKFYEILDAVVKKYMPLSALQLSALTHQAGTPWSQTREQGKDCIDDNDIAEHFRSIVQS